MPQQTSDQADTAEDSYLRSWRPPRCFAHDRPVDTVWVLATSFCDYSRCAVCDAVYSQVVHSMLAWSHRAWSSAELLELWEWHQLIVEGLRRRRDDLIARGLLGSEALVARSRTLAADDGLI